MDKETEVKLGKLYKDSITGFTGVATAVTIYLYGCRRVALESKKEKNEDGTSKEFWFDEQRLISKSKAGPGGPQKVPQKRADPMRR